MQHKAKQSEEKKFFEAVKNNKKQDIYSQLFIYQNLLKVMNHKFTNSSNLNRQINKQVSKQVLKEVNMCLLRIEYQFSKIKVQQIFIILLLYIKIFYLILNKKINMDNLKQTQNLKKQQLTYFLHSYRKCQYSNQINKTIINSQYLFCSVFKISQLVQSSHNYFLQNQADSWFYFK
ncbi:hypothetical protein ABPG74_000378 [Tetrahymena malaccensis]